MKNIDSLVRQRRSVRTFAERDASAAIDQLMAFASAIENPYGIPVEFRLLRGVGCPVVVGTDIYVGAKVRNVPFLNEAVGYSFELLVLHAQSLGLGTVWIGGTMDRAAFEAAMELKADEVMPCVSPLGYPAEKMSVRETMMRKAVKAEARLPFEELFFDGDPDTPLTDGGCLTHPLEMVRLAPSAVNRQPWRVVVRDGAAHFYLKRAKGMGGGTLDMQKLDLGIALCHFELAAKAAGLCPKFLQKAPEIDAKGLEYIATYGF